MGSVDSRPERNGHRTSASRWDIAGLGASEGGEWRRAYDGGGWGELHLHWVQCTR